MPKRKIVGPAKLNPGDEVKWQGGYPSLFFKEHGESCTFLVNKALDHDRYEVVANAAGTDEIMASRIFHRSRLRPAQISIQKSRKRRATKVKASTHGRRGSTLKFRYGDQVMWHGPRPPRFFKKFEGLCIFIARCYLGGSLYEVHACDRFTGQALGYTTYVSWKLKHVAPADRVMTKAWQK